MKNLISVLIAFCTCISAFAQTAPAGRLVDWTYAGYRGVIPNPTQIVDVTSFGAVGDGITNDHAAIISAKNSLSGIGVLFFPPGDYKVNNEINLPGNIILRGAGADSSIISFDLGGGGQNCINIVAAQSGNFYAAMSGYQKGSNKITVDSIQYFTSGSFCEILQDNGTWDTQPAIWAEQSVGQIFLITSISGDTLIVDRPLRMDFSAGLNPRLRVVNPVSDVGLECIGIRRIDNPMGNSGYNISCSYAINCWFYGLESNKSAGAHVLALRSSNLTFRGCYFHDAYEFTGSSTKGYGLVLAEHSNECLIENSVFKKLRHAMMVKQGANGNVFAYNYCREPLRSEFPTDAGADLSLHGHFAFANLFEGNIIQNLFIDQAWGPSGQDNLFFRNRAELYGIIMTSGTVESDDQIFVGNEVVNTGPLLGNYLLAGTGHFEHGNNIKGSIIPGGTNTLTDNSYYLQAAPLFWNISSSWPSIGIPNTINTGNIPAKDRYLGGGQITVCADLLSSAAEVASDQILKIFPNPSSGICYLNEDKVDNIELYDFTGKKLDCLEFDRELGMISISKKGLFILQIQFKGTTQYGKLLVF